MASIENGGGAGETITILYFNLIYINQSLNFLIIFLSPKLIYHSLYNYHNTTIVFVESVSYRVMNLWGKRWALSFSFCFILAEKEVTKGISDWLLAISRSPVEVLYMSIVVCLVDICSRITCWNRYCSGRVSRVNRYDVERPETCHDPKTITSLMRWTCALVAVYSSETITIIPQ